MPRFVRRHENGNIEIFSFTGVAMVGRSRRNQVSIDDQSVSSTHAKVELADGSWTIYDLESRNGTRINDAEIKVGKLKPGDSVRFGKINLTFEVDEAEAGKVKATEPAKVASSAPAAKPGGGGIEMAPAPSPSPGFGHTMAPFATPAAVAKASAEVRAERPAEKAVAVAAPPAEKPPDGGIRLKADQSELKVRVLKEQVRGLMNQRLILMSVAAGFALTTVILLIWLLREHNRAVSAEHGLRPAGEETK